MLRLVLIIFLFLCSLLCITSAPEFYLWYVAILATEFSWVFLFAVALLLVWRVPVRRYQIAGTIIGLAALPLFLSPIVRALAVAKGIDEQMELSFRSVNNNGAAPAQKRSPFHLIQMFAGVKEPPEVYSVRTFATVDKSLLTMDFYNGMQMGRKPCIVVVHGGSWKGGDSRQLPELNSHLAAEGYNVASINYRMAPGFHSPAPVEDVQAAMAYLRQHSGEMEIDTNNFVLLGRSAGAQIALAAAYRLHEHGLRGVISFYGPADMIWGYKHPGNPLIMNSCKVIEDYIGGAYAQVPGQYKECSPIEWVTSESVPTLLIAGKNDPLVAYEHNLRLSDTLAKYHVPYYLLTLPWATHGFDYTLNGPGGQLSTYTVDRFLQRITGHEQ